MPQKNSDELFREVRVLSQQVARKDHFLAETSCMSKEQRELYGFLVMFRMLTKSKTLRKYEKLVQVWGLALWGRTELTDLGLRLGENIVSSEY